MLRDGVERERLFDRLWEDVEEEPELARVIRAEREDLEQWRRAVLTGRCPHRTRSGPALASSSLASSIDPDSNKSNPVFVGLQTTTSDRSSVGCFGRLSCRLAPRLTAGDDPRMTTATALTMRSWAWRWGGRAPMVDDVPRKRVTIGPLMAAPLDPEEYVEAAVRVARRLEKLAFVDGVRCGLAGVTTDHDASMLVSRGFDWRCASG